LTEQLIGQLGYVGIALILILGGLGLPIPEEAPIILAAVLSRNGHLTWPLALASCLGGVLLGDLVVYFLGYFYGEKVLSLPITRRLLTRQREAQIKGYFHRHGFKILVSGRFVPGFRTAAYLTAGILKLPTLKLFLTDFLAASLSTCLMFGLGYAFANEIQKGIREVQQLLTLGAAVAVAVFLLYRYYRAQHRAGQLIGPPVLDTDEVPLPPDDFRSDQPGSKSQVDCIPEPEVDTTRTQHPGETPDLGESLHVSDLQSSSRGRPEPSESSRSEPVAGARSMTDSVAVEIETSRSQPTLESPSH
jgi:membrane protein DedA with SNARE-associated domain